MKSQYYPQNKLARVSFIHFSLPVYSRCRHPFPHNSTPTAFKRIIVCQDLEMQHESTKKSTAEAYESAGAGFRLFQDCDLGFRESCW